MGSVDDVDSVHEEMFDNKRQKRNTSEKRRRDSFNKLITELHGIVTSGERKLDKCNVLKQTINYLKADNQSKSRNPAASHNKWKPSFLTNQEYVCLMLEGMNAFVLVLTNTGTVLFASDELKRLLRRKQPTKGMYLYDILDERSSVDLRSFLSSEVLRAASGHSLSKNSHQQTIHNVSVNMRCGADDMSKNLNVTLTGKFKRVELSAEDLPNLSSMGVGLSPSNDMLCFVCVGRATGVEGLQAPALRLSLGNEEKLEFSSVFSMEWKFLSLDQKALGIVGYMSFEVLGNSGYDYYHPDDLDQIVEDHRKLMEQSEVTMRPYRFLTKGQQWLRIQSRAYITLNQWSSKPEFVVCNSWVLKDSDDIPDEPTISSTTKKINHSSDLKTGEETSVEKGMNDASPLNKKFRPQPGVSIEHTPILPSPRPRPQRRHTTTPPPLPPSLSSKEPGVSLDAFEPSDIQIYEQLQFRQANLQQQIMQQQQELLTLQQQLIRNVSGRPNEELPSPNVTLDPNATERIPYVSPRLLPPHPTPPSLPPPPTLYPAPTLLHNHPQQTFHWTSGHNH